MARKNPHATSTSRLSRFGVGLGFKSPTSTKNDNEDWYIPYNGPYEVPKDSHHHKHRDSWGDLIEGNGMDNVIFESYHVPLQRKKEDYGGWTFPTEHPDERKSRQVTSAVPTEPQVRSTSNRRRSTHSSAHSSHPSNLSHVAGGIGESPVPVQRHLSPAMPTLTHRKSLATFLPFGGVNKKSLHWPSFHEAGEDVFASRDGPIPRPATAPVTSKTPSRGRLAPGQPPTRDTAPTDDEEYYNSYYSTLRTTPKTEREGFEFKSTSADNGSPTKRMSSPIVLRTERNSIPQDMSKSTVQPAEGYPPQAPSPTRPHPYAYVFPSAAFCVDPQSAPGVPHAVLPRRKSSRATGTSSEGTHPSRTTTNNLSHVPGHLKAQVHSRMKTSISTPNLRGAAKQQPHDLSSLPSGKERWLSAETWCDALLFPRPRFKVKTPPGFEGGAVTSGRIVSPPGSPVLRSVDLSAEHYEWTTRKEVPPPQPGLSRGSSKKKPKLRSPQIEVRDLAGSDEAGEKSPLIPKVTRDDLALPSPVPSLDRVIQEGDALDEERKVWREQARRSFQNKRTRSLSRSRSKSVSRSGSQRRRKDGGEGEKPGDEQGSDKQGNRAGVKAMGSIDFLAARTLLGNQSIAPSIQVSRSKDSGRGTQTTSADAPSSTLSYSHSHSNSKSSKGSQTRGHSRNPSWGKKVANAAGALCGANEDPSPLAEKTDILERALHSDETTRVHLHDPAAMDEIRKGEENTTSGGGLRGNLGVPDAGKGISSPSPAPSGMTSEGVGIALSTSDDQQHFESLHMPDHPYGAHYSQTYATPTTSDQRRWSVKSADYAGPHPSSMTQILAASDLSTRHRLPPHATLHPFSQLSSPVSDSTASGDVSPRSRTWAQLSHGRVLSDDTPHSPYRNTFEDTNQSNHAYILPNRNRDTRLSVGEALTTAFGRSDRRDTTSGPSGYPVLERSLSLEKHDERTENPPSVRNSTASIEGALTQRIRRKPPPVMAEPFSEPPTEPPSRPDNPTPVSDTNSNHKMAPPTILDTSKRHASPSPSRDVTSYNSSPGVASQGSSPQISPRPWGSNDDLDRFRDLFYYPTQSNLDEASDMNAHSPPMSGISWDVSSSTRTASGLTSLARQLSQELEELHAAEETSSLSDIPPGQRFGGLRGPRPPDISTDLHFVLSEMGRSQSSSPTGFTSPLHLNLDRQSSPIIPEDVESSRASSPLEQPDEDNADHTFGLFRLGAVEAVVTPAAVEADPRASGHLSVIEEDTRRQSEEHTAIDPEAQRRIQSGSSGLQPSSADWARVSYMTSGTDGSRISGLSDFPAPPVAVTPAHMSVLTSYFGSNPVPQQTESLSEAATDTSTLRRMTFGGIEDTEKINDVPATDA